MVLKNEGSHSAAWGHGHVRWPWPAAALTPHLSRPHWSLCRPKAVTQKGLRREAVTVPRDLVVDVLLLMIEPLYDVAIKFCQALHNGVSEPVAGTQLGVVLPDVQAVGGAVHGRARNTLPPTSSYAFRTVVCGVKWCRMTWRAIAISARLNRIARNTIQRSLNPRW
jgi:hypothetical protein